MADLYTGPGGFGQSTNRRTAKQQQQSAASRFGTLYFGSEGGYGSDAEGIKYCGQERAKNLKICQGATGPILTQCIREAQTVYAQCRGGTKGTPGGLSQANLVTTGWQGQETIDKVAGVYQPPTPNPLAGITRPPAKRFYDRNRCEPWRQGIAAKQQECVDLGKRCKMYPNAAACIEVAGMPYAVYTCAEKVKEAVKNWLLNCAEMAPTVPADNYRFKRSLPIATRRPPLPPPLPPRRPFV